MGATTPGSLPRTPKRDSRALWFGSSTRPITVATDLRHGGGGGGGRSQLLGVAINKDSVECFLQDDMMANTSLLVQLTVAVTLPKTSKKKETTVDQTKENPFLELTGCVIVRYHPILAQLQYILLYIWSSRLYTSIIAVFVVALYPVLSHMISSYIYSCVFHLYIMYCQYLEHPFVATL